MKPGIKAGLISFVLITSLYAISYYFKLYQINAVFNVFPLTIAPFLGVFFIVQANSATNFAERLKGAVQASLVAGFLFALVSVLLLKVGIIQHELLNSSNLILNFGMTINIFAMSGAFIGAIFSAVLYKKKKA